MLVAASCDRWSSPVRCESLRHDGTSKKEDLQADSLLFVFLFESAHLRGIRISRSARTENPPDYDPHEQNARNVDEMGGGWHQLLPDRFTSVWRRSTSR